MNIGVIGSGNVGGTLGKRWIQAGHKVIFSARDQGSAAMQKLLSEAGPSASAASVADAVAGSDVVLLATPWPSARSAVESAGDFRGKVLIDAVNPLSPDLTLSIGTNTSAAEQIASWAHGARVVKAFNTVGAGIMENPHFDEGQPVLFYCGDDAEAKKTVHQLIAQLGFDAVDAGPLVQARILESFAGLWISLAVKQGFGVNIAFRFMRR